MEKIKKRIMSNRIQHFKYYFNNINPPTEISCNYRYAPSHYGKYNNNNNNNVHSSIRNIGCLQILAPGDKPEITPAALPIYLLLMLRNCRNLQVFVHLISTSVSFHINTLQ
jgi:hypothetical protein